MLKEATELGVNLYEEHQRFVKSFDPQWRSDENVMLLLSAIALFTPERANVVHKDVVKLEQVRLDFPTSNCLKIDYKFQAPKGNLNFENPSTRSKVSKDPLSLKFPFSFRLRHPLD